MFTNKFSHAALLTLAASMVASAQTPFIISNVHSALVMNDTPWVPTWSTINQDTPTGGTNQQWVLHRPGTAIVYEIRSVASGMVVSVNTPSSGFAVLGELVVGSPEQLWQISRAAGSTGYEILSEVLQETSSPGSLPTYARLALDVPGSSTSAGEYIQQYKENNGTNQQWQFHPQTGNSTILVSAFDSSIVITGYNFQANTRVCPVLESAVGLPQSVGSCISTGNGIFTYVYPVPSGYNFSSTGGYVVMAVEDQNGNVLAIGSAPGSYTAKL